MSDRHQIATIALTAAGLAASHMVMALGVGDVFPAPQGVNVSETTERRLDIAGLDRANPLPYRHLSEEALEELDADTPLGRVGETAWGEALLDPAPLGHDATFHF
ncbi:hypothetical protein FIU83_12165 [Halomonas sp. THAF5a]|uniref:hypothetical protein n=1 Tax=Halomonas sp. THAF5a TaxID=2587844 RepID=UPI001268F152|nr:hypothetical protein [Halomonas sp. THAF5a]QFU02392.1 hypothetical protein FIU83_12165 [Halomonas sp. THAF5a]